MMHTRQKNSHNQVNTCSVLNSCRKSASSDTSSFCRDARFLNSFFKTATSVSLTTLPTDLGGAGEWNSSSAVAWGISQLERLSSAVGPQSDANRVHNGSRDQPIESDCRKTEINYAGAGSCPA